MSQLHNNNRFTPTYQPDCNHNTPAQRPSTSKPGPPPTVSPYALPAARSADLIMTDSNSNSSEAVRICMGVGSGIEGGTRRDRVRAQLQRSRPRTLTIDNCNSIYSFATPQGLLASELGPEVETGTLYNPAVAMGWPLFVRPPTKKRSSRAKAKVAASAAAAMAVCPDLGGIGPPPSWISSLIATSNAGRYAILFLMGLSGSGGNWWRC
jgi:hypothetical protein